LQLAKRAYDINHINHGVFADEHKLTPDATLHDDGSKKIPPISELKSGWSSDKDVPKLTHKYVESYLLHSSHRTNDHNKMTCYRHIFEDSIFSKKNMFTKL